MKTYGHDEGEVRVGVFEVRAFSLAEGLKSTPLLHEIIAALENFLGIGFVNKGLDVQIDFTVSSTCAMLVARCLSDGKPKPSLHSRRII